MVKESHEYTVHRTASFPTDYLKLLTNKSVWLKSFIPQHTDLTKLKS